MEVRLIAHTPDPDRVCAIAAKNCVSSKLPEDVENMNSLVHALKGGHTSVAENATFTFAIEGISRVVEIQLVRHRVGASYAIQSGRYVAKGPTDMVIPQSIEDAMADDRENGNGHLDEVFDRYKEAVDELATSLKMAGAKDQDIRYFYPQGAKTNIILTMNGRSLLHYFALRLCTRAQSEHRELAEKMLALVKPVAPVLFADAGPSCRQLLYCPEENGCGKYPKISEMYVRIKLDDSVPDCKTCKKGFVKWEAPEDD